MNPFEPVLLVFGKINGGSFHNIIPDEVAVSGTLRLPNNPLVEKVKDLLLQYCRHFAKLNGIDVRVNFSTTTPAFRNDRSLADKFVKSLKNSGSPNRLMFNDHSSMGADDFSFYTTEFPGLYFRIGAEGKGNLHSGQLLLKEDLIEPAVTDLVIFISELFER